MRILILVGLTLAKVMKFLERISWMKLSGLSGCFKATRLLVVDSEETK